MDRNAPVKCNVTGDTLSLSARRAWIEIEIIAEMFNQVAVALRKESVDRNTVRAVPVRQYYVALRKESVDRNVDNALYDVQSGKSLSARRAWIEIFQWAHIRSAPRVALRKESVDRNLSRRGRFRAGAGRSPQGERG